MHYIILDLQWNQPLSYQSHVYREVGDKLIFEMIQIGAVKLDSRPRWWWTAFRFRSDPRIM